MTNPNPFLPHASLAEKQNQRRSRLKLAVSCVLAVSVVGLVAMLIQGCKREEPPVLDNPNTDTNMTSNVDTNTPAGPDTNVVTGAAPAGAAPGAVNGGPAGAAPAGVPSGIPQAIPQPPQAQPLPVPPVPQPDATADTTGSAGGSEYTVAKGDTLGKIAHHNGVSLKALEAANPGVTPTKLKVGQKLTIPAGGKSAASAGGASVSGSSDTASASGFITYTIKSGDSLRKIAKAHHTTVKALQAANHLTTPAIKVGHKLKIPVKAAAAPVEETAPAAPVAPVAPVQDTVPAPVAPPVQTQQPVSAPAPGQPGN